MKKTERNDQINFNEYCKKAMKEAVIIASAFVASLNLNNLETQKRLRRIYIENDSLQDEIELLNRVNYVLNIMDLPALFLIFDRMNFLHNAEELEKLKQAFMLAEKHKSIKKLIIENYAALEEENFHARLWALKAMDNINGLDKQRYEEASKLEKEDDYLNETNQISSENSEKPITSLLDFPLSFCCIISFKLLKDELQKIYNRTRFLASQADLDELYLALISDDLSKVKKIFYLKCQTNKFKSIIILLQKDFNSLSYANIERSNLFRSKKGKPISRSNMSSANCIILEKKHFLKDIYK